MTQSLGQGQGHRSKKGQKFLFPQVKLLVAIHNSGSTKHTA